MITIWACSHRAFDVHKHTWAAFDALSDRAAHTPESAIALLLELYVGATEQLYPPVAFSLKRVP